MFFAIRKGFQRGMCMQSCIRMDVQTASLRVSK